MTMQKSRSIYTDSFDEFDTLKDSMEKVEKLFSEEDLKNAEAFGHANGYSEGLNEGFVQGEIQAIREKDMQLQSALQSINDQFTMILLDNRSYIDQLEKNTVELALILIKTILPNLTKKYLKSEMLLFVQNIVSKIIKVQKVDISAHPEIYDILHEKISEYFGENSEKITLHSEKDKDITECLVRWDGGYAFSNILENFTSIQQEIRDAYQIDESLLTTLNTIGE